jgi:hypothetical protein
VPGLLSADIDISLDIIPFERVIGATGHPTQAEFLNICQENYRDFELRATEDAASTHLLRVITERDMRSNTIRLWRVVMARRARVDAAILSWKVWRLQQRSA